MTFDHHPQECPCGQKWMIHYEASKTKVCDVLRCYCGREIEKWAGYFVYIAEPLPPDWRA
ncbi:MAG: hypothetical protein M3Z23_04950 [Acidobacteriota bacterium]|nr:hypothetical protein [Acidobacteriota bacterium]